MGGVCSAPDTDVVAWRQGAVRRPVREAGRRTGTGYHTLAGTIRGWNSNRLGPRIDRGAYPVGLGAPRHVNWVGLVSVLDQHDLVGQVVAVLLGVEPAPLRGAETG